MKYTFKFSAPFFFKKKRVLYLTRTNYAHVM